MIQFNLLPDVKIEFIRTRRLKRMMTLIAGSVAGSAFLLFVLLYIGVAVMQKEHLEDLSTEINAKSKQLADVKDLDKMLTIQNQLNAITGLHDKKYVASRVPGYLRQVTPATATVTNTQMNFDTGVMTLTGNSPSLEVVNKFVDTLKFTTYSIKDTKETPAAFSKVVLTSFGRTEKQASYTIDLVFDQKIFVVTSEVKLIVPNIITTRSDTEKPGASSPAKPVNPVEGQ